MTEQSFQHPGSVSWTAACRFCKSRGAMRPGAGKITLYSHGVICLEYFCSQCREYNRVAIPVLLAEALTRAGIPTIVVMVPAEMSEHPPEGTRPIAEVECAHLEAYPLDLFQSRAMKEFGL